MEGLLQSMGEQLCGRGDRMVAVVVDTEKSWACKIEEMDLATVNAALLAKQKSPVWSCVFNKNMESERQGMPDDPFARIDGVLQAWRQVTEDGGSVLGSGEAAAEPEAGQGSEEWRRIGAEQAAARRWCRASLLARVGCAPAREAGGPQRRALRRTRRAAELKRWQRTSRPRGCPRCRCVRSVPSQG